MYQRRRVVLSKPERQILELQGLRGFLYVCPVDARDEEGSFTISLVIPILAAPVPVSPPFILPAPPHTTARLFGTLLNEQMLRECTDKNKPDLSIGTIME